MTGNAESVPAKKPSILRWHGVLAGRSRTVRLVTGAMLMVVCMTLSCCQLGFAGIGVPGEYSAYAIVLLFPVAIGALLLGILWGGVIGLFAGVVLYLHAVFIPLDYYEFIFVTPVTSIAMMTITGFLLGLLFAVALRNRPGPVKSAIYICIVCWVVSMLYSVGFVVSISIQMVVDAALNDPQSFLGEDQYEAAQLTLDTIGRRFGDVGLQRWVDAAGMAICCIVADIVVRLVEKRKRRVGMRSLFAVWLSVVVMLAFMITAPVSFVFISQEEYRDCATSMTQEVDYICRQLEESVRHVDALVRFVSNADANLEGVSEEGYSDLLSTLSTDNLLSGFAPREDGKIVIAILDDDDYIDDESAGESAGADSSEDLAEDVVEDAVISQSNDEQYHSLMKLSEVFSDEVLDAIKLSLATKQVKRAIYDKGANSSEKLTADERVIQSQIVYLYAQRQDYYLVIMIQPSEKVFSERGSVMAWTTLSEFVLLLAVFALVQVLLSRVVVRRLDETNVVLGEITHGNLDARVDVRDTHELESLSEGINDTVDALEGWIAEAETRMDAELSTAKAIQEAALPRTFPPFPDIKKFDIYASMKAAKEVGGDFYDFFLIGDDSSSEEGKLGFVMADVSGKGVPAALFMMKAMAQIRGYMESGMEVGEAVENANRQLVNGNDAGMFVTAWAGVLDYSTGHVDYVNAGHNPPLLWQQDGGWRWLTEKSGMPLGLFDGFGYEAFSIDCQVGDQFLLYTDGVTEAMDVEGKLYGEERLMALANENFMLHPSYLVETVRHDVSKHAEGAEQSDDITILALEVGVPSELTAVLTVPADVDELPRVNDFIHAELDRRLCPLRAQSQLDVAVEELFVNVCHYAYPDATPDNPGKVRVSFTYSGEPPTVVIGIADKGIPYDPLAKPDAVTPDDIMEVPIGGLGILMAKKSVDEMHYERIDDENVVHIVKRW